MQLKAYLEGETLLDRAWWNDEDEEDWNAPSTAEKVLEQILVHSGRGSALAKAVMAGTCTIEWLIENRSGGHVARGTIELGANSSTVEADSGTTLKDEPDHYPRGWM